MERNSAYLSESRLLPTTWWHFDRYVLDGGRIRPAPGARGERYDPWDSFQAARRGRPVGNSPRRRVELPYQRLMSIAQEYFERPEKRRPGRPRRTEEQLLNWCSDNGLLGLLHHQLVSARIPARIDERKAIQGMIVERTASGWSSQLVPARRQRRSRGSRSLSDMLPDGTLLQWFPTGELRWEPFDGEWSHYFQPDSPLRSPQASRSRWNDQEEAEETPPLPSQEAFWREYGEPLPNVIEAGMRLADAVQQVGRELESSEEADGSWPRGPSALAELAMPITPVLRIDQDEPRLHWSAPSLLANLALMAMSDIAGGARIISCKRCGAPTVTRSHRGLYCSERCRNR
jgi:hypothetical protein